MTTKAQARTGARRQPSASAPPSQVLATSPGAPPGRLTKMAAKVNSEISRKAKGKGGKPKPRTRRDKKGLVLYVDPEVTVALRRLSLDTGSSVQALGIAALNLLFQHHGVQTFPPDTEQAVASDQH